ncbi:MAG: prevent-host-death protein [Lachnospiraceae bacterium]
MPNIRPITDLRNTNEISDICHAKNEPVFITKNGMRIETYEEMLNTLHIDTAIAEAEAEYNSGAELLDAKEALASLRRRHFG